MKKIFQVQEKYEDRWVLDPEKGAVKRHERLMQPSDTERIVMPKSEHHPEGKTYEKGPDGSFEVDDHTAAFHLARAGWHEGISPFADNEPTPHPDSFKSPRVSNKD